MLPIFCITVSSIPLSHARTCAHPVQTKKVQISYLLVHIQIQDGLQYIQDPSQLSLGIHAIHHRLQCWYNSNGALLCLAAISECCKLVLNQELPLVLGAEIHFTTNR